MMMRSWWERGGGGGVAGLTGHYKFVCCSPSPQHLRLTIFKDKVFNELIKVNRGLLGWLLICMTGVLIEEGD